ncbi:MAG: hypothetical protein ACLFTT_14050 [Candidatus Hydrogenedentota bacterium]
MISPDAEDQIITQCRQLCARFELDQAYIAQAVGPRRHYLAGYGNTADDKPHQLQLSDSLVLLWQGYLSEAGCTECQRCLRALAQRIEEELHTWEPPAQDHAEADTQDPPQHEDEQP